MTRRHRPVLLSRALVLLALAGAPACAPAFAGPPGAGQTWVSERLFFGRTIPGGGVVSDAEWATFLREVVTPRFPDGLTTWRAEGQWREATGEIVAEPSMVLEVYHRGTAADFAAVGEIADAYRTRFRQEAVLRVTDRVRVRF